MPATNYTPIQLYRSTTSGNTPLAANMSAGEIALNIADNDMSMWMENASGTVKRFFNNPAALKYPTADGTSGQVIVTDGSGNLSFATPAGGALTNNVRQAVTSSATTTLNLNSGNVIDLTMAANITTLSFTNVPASGTPILIQIVVRNASDGTAYTITWPNSVYWSGQYAATTISTVQTAPTLATGANGITVIALLTTDGGTKWRGWVEATITGGQNNAIYLLGGFGYFGVNDSIRRSSPVQIGSLTNWVKLASNNNAAFAINNAGQLFAWGGGSYGVLGTGDVVARSSPVQIGALTNWASVSTGAYSAAAIKTDGTLWTWGRNNRGQLGLNNTTNYSSPKQVGALTTWSSVAVGAQSVIATTTSGALWSWGRNSAGTLGLNDTTDRSSPVQIGALTTWSKVASSSWSYDAGASFAIKTDGTLWSWGRNIGGSNGLLGQGTAGSNISSPTQVGALTNWRSVHPGTYLCLAVKTDNTLWAWGSGASGGLGNNATPTYVASPIQIGSLTDWWIANGGNQRSSAIKTNGTLWTWGNNTNGVLGLNNQINASSPVQVGALTTWGPLSGNNNLLAGSHQFFAATSSTVNPA